MSKSRFPLLSEEEQLTLHDALHYMKMDELKKASEILGLSDKGKKAHLIEQILIFINQGKIIAAPTIPAHSRAKHHPAQPLAPFSLMLYGSYKNDLKTREFFKKLIGPHFHFTAFGIDWLHEQWLQGKPPTYQEFANFWEQEAARRKKENPTPKDEWMFIRFMQNMNKEEPDARQEDRLSAWQQIQNQKKEEGFFLVYKAKKTL